MTEERQPNDTKIEIQSTEDFATRVLQESHQRLVVVDFWAPWCGPCQMIGPALEAFAAAGKGRWCLAKVNIDEHQALAIEFEVRSIPAVYAFSKGEVVDQFVGALPPAQIEAWLARWLPGPADEALEAGRAAQAQGDRQTARAAYERALDLKPLFAPAILALARLDLEEDQRDAARQRLQSIVAVDDDALEKELAALRLQLSQESSGDLDALLAQHAAQPDDLDLALKLGHAYATAARHEDALRTFLSIIEQSRTGPGEQAKEAMVQLFAVIGMHDDLTTHYRKALSQVLFS